MRRIGDITELRIAILGAHGLYARTIARLVTRWDGTQFSVSTVYAVLKRQGIRLRDYREGLNDESEAVIQQALKAAGPEKKGRKKRKGA